MTTAPFRVGRHNKRLVYQLTFRDGPSDNDRLVAVFFDAKEAQDFVDIVNSEIDRGQT
jgi:hypothetical protein